MSYRALAIGAAVMLVIALADLPYGYYTLLRIVVCGVALYGAYIASTSKATEWVIPLGIIALVFNPLIPIYLSREIWAVVDVLTAGSLIASAVAERKWATTSNHG